MASLKSKLDENEKLNTEIKSLKQKKHTSTVASRARDTNMEELQYLEPRSRRNLRGHYGKVYAMQWASDSLHLVSASQDGNMIVWDANSMRKIYRIELRSNWVMTCAFGQCGEGRRSNFIACGGLDNVLSVYDVSKKPNDSAYGPIELNGHDGYLSCCRFIGEREMLTSSGDGHIFHWDLERKKKVAQFEGHAMDVMCVAISPTNENIFASGSVDETVKVWDRRDSSMRCTHTFQKFHTSDINAVAFFPEGWSVGTGSDDSTCRIFDIRCYGQVSKFEAEGQSNGAVTSVAFSKSGRLLFAGYESNKCCGWDVLDNSNTPSWEAGKEHNERVSCLGVSPNGHALCTGSWDTHLRIWA